MLPSVGPRSGSPSTTLGAKPRVLIVDESLPVRNTLLDILHKLGTRDEELAVACDEDEALAWFDGHTPTPGVVFAEFVGVRNDDGLDLLHEMLERAPTAKIVLVTAEPRDAPVVRAALRAGVFAYLEKPVRQDKVRQVLQDIQEEKGDTGRI
jgi:DNA-binding NtrC family response regulator